MEGLAWGTGENLSPLEPLSWSVRLKVICSIEVGGIIAFSTRHDVLCLFVLDLFFLPLVNGNFMSFLINTCMQYVLNTFPSPRSSPPSY